MKILDVNWTVVLDNLPRWSAMPPSARRKLLDTLKPSDTIPIARYGEYLEDARESGIVSVSPTNVRVSDEARDLVRVLRAMDRHARLIADPTTQFLVAYLTEHFTSEDISALTESSSTGYWYGRNSPYYTAGLVSSLDWIENFLALRKVSDAVEWEIGRRGRSARPIFMDGPTFDAAQRLVRLLVAHPEGLTLVETRSALSMVSPDTAARAVHAALRFVLALAILDPDTLEPRLTLWPPTAYRLNEPDPEPPLPVEPVDIFHAASMMEDMTAVLVAVASDPPRLRGNDLEIFARNRQAIQSRLASVPEWITEEIAFDHDARVNAVVQELRRMKLVKVVGSVGKDLRLEATAAGSRWLGRSENERLATLIDPIRKSPEEDPFQPRFGRDDPLFFPALLGADLAPDRYGSRSRLTEALLALPAESFYPVDDFIEYESRLNNPFLVEVGGKLTLPKMRYSQPTPGREHWERAWEVIATAFLYGRLVLLGGVRLGVTADGRICFQLTGIGRYLLGAADTFTYGHEVDADIVVQPNFEIVFLTPAPRLEAQLGRFTRRVGSGPGVMFRIDRESILAAAEAGLTPDDIVGTLRRASSRELPANVERQITDWLGAVRHVSMRRALIIRCPDAATAAKVRSAGGKHVRMLTDTVLESSATDSAARKTLLLKLRKLGIFVEARTSESADA